MNNPSKQLISDFIAQFLGYGNLDSPYWFIGKEEGGGKTMDENLDRITAWMKMADRGTVDLMEFNEIPFPSIVGNVMKWKRRVQPTWKGPLQILLTLANIPITKESLLQFQCTKLATKNGNNLMAEFMPLPSPSTAHWFYADAFSWLSEMKTRKAYFDSVAPQRAQLIHTLVKKHRPKLVHFYSTDGNYMRYWSRISGCPEWHFEAITPTFKAAFYKSDGTLFVVSPHPTRNGIKYEDFILLGKKIAESISI